MANLTFREAQKSDLAELSKLLDLLFTLEQDFTPDTSRQIRGLEMMLELPFSTVIVAELDGRIAGLCGVQCVVSTAEGAFSGMVEDLVLFPECRGLGLGGLLLDEAEKWAAAQGATRMQLNCDDKNDRAIGFYRKHGWGKTHLFNYFKPVRKEFKA